MPEQPGKLETAAVNSIVLVKNNACQIFPCNQIVRHPVLVKRATVKIKTTSFFHKANPRR